MLVGNDLLNAVKQLRSIASFQDLATNNPPLLMTENTKLIEALETISKETDVPVKEIIGLLTGFCWNEEEGFELGEWAARRV